VQGENIMTPAINITSKLLNIDDLKLLSQHTGPCVTISIPPNLPGAGGGTRHADLRHLTQIAVAQLGHLNRPEAAKTSANLAGALELLAATLDDGHGGPGLTLFGAPGFTAAYETPGVRAHAVTVGDHFVLLPLVAAAKTPSHFFVLGISKNKPRLLHYSNGRVEELALPASVPVSLEAAGAFDEPEHTMDSHSPAGPSVGGLRGVRFASSGDQDSNAVYLRHFFGLVDRGLKERLNGANLFLAGVHEELSLYRKTAKYPHIFESECHGNAEHASLDQVAKHAAAGALREYRLAADRAFQALPEKSHKIAGDAGAVLRAATEGRVRQIFVAEDGTPKETLNAAVVEGLRTGAEVFTYPGTELPGFGATAAVLRY
jgi:Bacterial archaeo-eukaryotic release factor family 3